MIRNKAESAGCKVVFVNPSNTTQECYYCGAIVRKTLKDRIHSCPSCGACMDRDLNSALNILKRATTVGHTGSKACGVASSEEVTVKQEAPAL